MKKLLCLLLVLLTFGCAFETPIEAEDDSDMKQYPHANKAPPHGVPLVAPVVPRNGPWSGDNQLGYVLPFKPNARGEQTILKMDEWGPPEMWTLSLSPIIIPSGLNVDSIDIDFIARIEFGVGGATHTVLMDWADGAQISLPMNAVNVVAVVRFVSPTLTDKISLSVQLARGTRPQSSLPPVYTVAKRVTLATANGDRYDLPPFTKSIRLVPSFGGAAGAEVTGDVAAVYNANLLVYTMDRVDQVLSLMRGSDFLTVESLPVDAGARYVRIDNKTGGNVVYNLICEIAG